MVDGIQVRARQLQTCQWTTRGVIRGIVHLDHVRDIRRDASFAALSHVRGVEEVVAVGIGGGGAEQGRTVRGVQVHSRARDARFARVLNTIAVAVQPHPVPDLDRGRLAECHQPTQTVGFTESRWLCGEIVNLICLSNAAHSFNTTCGIVINTCATRIDIAVRVINSGHDTGEARYLQHSAITYIVVVRRKKLLVVILTTTGSEPIARARRGVPSA